MRLFSAHIPHLLSAYCHGELSAKEARKVSTHLESCSRCRAEYAAIRKGNEALRQLPALSAPDSLWNRIEAGLSRAEPIKGPIRDFRLPPFVLQWFNRKSKIENRKSRRQRLALAGAALCGVVGLAILWRLNRHTTLPPAPTRPGWEVAQVSGTPRIGAQDLKQRGRLAPGEWLNTDSSSQAEIKVADIGTVQVAPNTRVRLVETGQKAHRLKLAEGKIAAKVKAPPRLFLVDTRAARAVDMGCAYTLRVDKAGITYLHVTSGLVVLEGRGFNSWVPAGATCETRPNTGPGTPCFTVASEGLKTALAKYDFENGGTTQLRIVLNNAQMIDTLPLWHLLSRVVPANRAMIYNRLAQLSPPPPGVTRAGILQGNQRMLILWRDQMAKSQWIW